MRKRVALATYSSSADARLFQRCLGRHAQLDSQDTEQRDDLNFKATGKVLPTITRLASGPLPRLVVVARRR